SSPRSAGPVLRAPTPRRGSCCEVAMEPIFRLPHFTMERVVKALSETYDWSLQFLGIPEAWKLAKGAGVTVAILDTGCDLNHPDLQGAIADYARFAPSGFPDVEDRVGHG